MSALSNQQFRLVTKRKGPLTISELHKRGGEMVAHAELEQDGPHTYVSYLKSHDEGKGHAGRLMEKVYEKSEGPVDWGYTLHPAATHLAEKFMSHPKYGSRTYHDGEME